jgi:hypothetical protein
MSSDVSAEGLTAALDEWAGARVAVRVTFGDPEQLVAVFSGRLLRHSREKVPALFWPIEEVDPPAAEEAGVYLHPDSFESAEIHPGDFVIELRQGPVTTNIRRLGSS